MLDQKPKGFLCYVHINDEFDEGYITDFRGRLSGEVEAQMGKKFEIFQDPDKIHVGEPWKMRIENTLDMTMFFIPFITPHFFNSKWCCSEFKRFRKREKRLKRRDLIIPVYYINTSLIGDKTKKTTNTIAQEVAKRQYIDWRELRFEPIGSLTVKREIANIATQIRDRVQSLKK
jgi:F-box protein 11